MKFLYYSTFILAALSASTSDAPGVELLELPSELLELIFSRAINMDPSLSAAQKWGNIRGVSSRFKSLIDDMVSKNSPGEFEVDKFLGEEVFLLQERMETDPKQAVKLFVHQILDGLETQKFAKFDSVAYSCKILRRILPICQGRPDLLENFEAYIHTDLKDWLKEKDEKLIRSVFSGDKVGKVMKTVKKFLPDYVSTFESIIVSIFMAFQAILSDPEIDIEKRRALRDLLLSMLYNNELPLNIDRKNNEDTIKSLLM